MNSNRTGQEIGVSVVLVAYHGDKWLPACLDSLAEASRSRLHLLLVDNTGNSGFDRLGLERFDTEVIETPRPMGFADANNHALTHAARLEAAVLFLNQDTISPAGWIDHCLDCLERDPQLGAVSPLIRTYDGTGWDPSFLACLPSRSVPEPTGDAVQRDWFYNDLAPAPALIVRTDVLRQAGPFDPVFGSYYEDYDLCRRIRALGFRIGFCRSARIQHFSGSTTDTPERERRRMRQIIRNRLLYGLREAGTGRVRRVLKHTLVDLPRNLARGIARTPSSQPPVVTLRAHWDLLQLFGRLVSQRHDEQQWQQYLEAIGWPDRVPGFAATSSVHHPA